MHSEYDMPNLNYNNNRYSPEEWEMVQMAFSRRIWGLKIARVTERAGRTERKTAIGRWSYRRDLDSLLIIAAVLMFCTVALSVTAGVILL